MEYKNKYLKYKSKYFELKNILNKTGGRDDFNSRIQFDHDDIIHIISFPDNNNSIAEYSRFNTKTKDVVHWYAQEICNDIINNLDNKNQNKNIKILVLGVALGSIIIHLLDKIQNAYVTGIDISSEYYNIVRKYSPSDRLELIEADGYEYIKNTESMYDIIISDIFDGIKVPDFILDYDFLNCIYKKLNPHGKFLLNTIGIPVNKLKEILDKVFVKSDIIIIENFKDSMTGNIVSIVKLL